MWKFIFFVGRLIKGLFWLTIVVIFTALVFLYIAERDLPANWLTHLSSQLSNDQFSVQIGRASYGLRRGLILHRLRAFTKGSIEQAFASVDETIVSLTIRPRRPYIEWIDAVTLRNLRCNDFPTAMLKSMEGPANHKTGRSLLNTIDLTGVDININDAEVAGMSFERISGRLSMTDGAMRLANLQLIWPLEHYPEILQGEITLRPDVARIEGRIAGKTTPKRLRPLLERLHARTVVRIGDKFAFTSDPIDTQCSFLVDPSTKRNQLRVAIKMRNIIYNGVPIREVSSVIEGSGPETLSRVVISPIIVRSDAGNAQATLIYEDNTETLDIDAQGQMAVGPLTQIIEVLNKGELSGVSFDHNPKLTVKGRVGVASNQPAPTDLSGTVSAQAVSLYGMPLRETSCNYRVKPDNVVTFTSFQGTTPCRGQIAGDFFLLPKTVGTNAAFCTSLRLTDLPISELCELFGRTNGPSGKLRANFEMTGVFTSNQSDQPAVPGHVRISEGAFNLKNGEVLGMPFEGISGKLSVKDDATLLSDITIVWPETRWPETAEGDLTIRTVDSRIEGRIKGYMTPAQLRPLFSNLHAASLTAIGDRFVFTNSPATAQGTFLIEPEADRYTLQVGVQAGDFTYNKVPIHAMHTVITAYGNATNNQVVIKPLIMETATGSAQATLIHDALTDTLDIDTEINMYVEPLTHIIDVLNHGELAGLRFNNTSKLTACGRIGLSPQSAAKTDLHGTLTTSDVNIYGLSLRSLSGAYRIVENFNAAITNFTATTPNGGEVTGELFLRPDSTGSNTAYRTALTFTTMDLMELFESFGSSNRPSGKVNALINLHGYLDRARIRYPTGQGRFTITGGSLSRIPLFAGFTEYLARNIPGIETLVNQSNGSCDFSATNGLISSSNILIEGEVFSLAGKGQYAMPTDRLDFLIQAGIFKRGSLIGKITHILTLPFSKLLLEFRVQGTTANPTWEYLGILQRIAETITDAVVPAEETKLAP